MGCMASFATYLLTYLDSSCPGERWICWATDPHNEEIYRLREVAVQGSDQFDPPDADSSVQLIITDAQVEIAKRSDLRSTRYPCAVETPAKVGAGVQRINSTANGHAQGVVMEDGVTPLTGDNRNYGAPPEPQINILDQPGWFASWCANLKTRGGADPPPSENDYCIALVIRHGNFSYFTGGDLDGTYSRSQACPPPSTRHVCLSSGRVE